MKIIGSKLAGLTIACACMALMVKPSLAESRLAAAPTLRFDDLSCLVPELAPSKLQSNGVPRSASNSNWWYIVINFDSVVQQGAGQRVRACLRVGRGNEEKIAKAITCETVGAVRIRRGIATFNGGTLECSGINVGAAGLEIGIPLKGSVKTASTFWMAVKGSLSPTVTDPVPLLAYAPVVTRTEEAGNVAFNLMPASDAQRPGFAASQSPSGNVQGPGLTIAVQPATTFTGLFETVPIQPAQTDSVYAWSIFGSGLVDAMPVSVPFTPIGISDSTLIIGGSSLGGRFYGTLDFVVLDPDGGGRTGG